MESGTVEKIEKIKSEGMIIAVVARLESEKRIDIAIDIFKSIYSGGQNIFLLIFGDGELKQKLVEHARMSGIESRVILFDYVNSLVSYYSYFDVLFFASEREGTPLSVFEAMANKIPIVAPDVGGFKEILDENDCGLIYSPGNIKEAEEKLLMLIKDESLRKKLGENGKIAVEKKYNSNNFIKQIEEVYLSLGK